MRACCNGLWGIDFQFLFAQDKEFLENILDKGINVYRRRMYSKDFYFTLQDLMYPPHPDVSDMQKIVKILQETFYYMHDISNNGKADIATYEFTLIQKKLEELLSVLPSDVFSDDDVAFVKYFGKEFVHELPFILRKLENQNFLHNIVSDMQMFLENPWFASQLHNSDLLPRLILTPEEINILIKGLKLLPQYFDDWDVEMRIGGSFLEIDILLAKLECWQSSMKFNVISDDNLNHLYTMINDSIDATDTIDCQSSLPCNQQFLEDIVSKIMVIMDNKIFFEKWADYNAFSSIKLRYR